MGTINVLSETAINQIAAGEVVEGPASVVKELVENAVDAGADSVAIEIKGGGHFLIEVADNGKGMTKEDVLLSTTRFATSKISTLDDLLKLNSMGFRGEALAAISSVSKFSILSSTGGVATLLECDGGKNSEVREAARGKGTTITVSSLFYNTPARKKFQKARGPSTTEIVKCITKLSLCHRDCTFSLVVDGKEVFHVDKCGKKRVEEVLGKDFFTPKIAIDYEGDGLSIKGMIAGAEKSRSNRLGQYLVVNKRNVYSLLVSNAVLAGFGTAMGKGDYPLFFLDMTFDPAKIDVNVHPQKKEIRFQEEERVFAMVREAIASALTGSFEVERPILPQVQSYPTTAAFKEFNYVEKKDIEELSSLPRGSFVQPHFEEQGHLVVKMLWDELCLLEVEAPHKKFPEVEDKECILIDLSLLEKEQRGEQTFLPQKLLDSEEIFLTQEEIGVCKECKEMFFFLGFEFEIKTVSVELLSMPEVEGVDRDTFLYAITLFERGEKIDDVQQKILFRVYRKKRYTKEEAIYLIEHSFSISPGRVVTKKDLRKLCTEYQS
ncbi:DNA mismatch repair endonuclease MutL [bacterium]|nr:DNA mismatch repair endonuclease MutL [bacterium]